MFADNIENSRKEAKQRGHNVGGRHELDWWPARVADRSFWFSVQLSDRQPFFIWLVTESSTFHCNNIGFDFGNVPIGDCAKFDGQ